MAGILFVVATPIGNLEDISLRALRVLKEVDLIAAEDTRRTAKLLARYDIRKPMVSLHEHNEVRDFLALIARLSAGASVALVSDAGTPGIADPGAHLVRAARDAGVPVSPIPGPSAVMAALSASGVATSEFVFMGFAPRSGGERVGWFARLASEPRTVVFFDVPHRISRTLAELVPILVDRPIHIHRELTKIHEEYIKQPNNEIMAAGHSMGSMGEFAVVVEPLAHAEIGANTPTELITRAMDVFGCLTNKCKFSDDEAVRIAAAALSIDGRAIRKAVKKARIAQKRQADRLS